jgi:hypothetical protein
VRPLGSKYFGAYAQENVVQGVWRRGFRKTSSDAMKMIQKDIKAKWDKFSDQELTSLKSRDDLVTQVVAKYGFERPQAQRDVDALLKGREIGQRA